MTTADAKAELEACPLCGTAAELIDRDWQKHWFVRCSNYACRCEIRWMDSKEAAIVRWNTRALEASHSMTEAITPEMIEAGKLAWIDGLGGSFAKVLTAIYTAMQAARPIDQQEAKRADVLGEVVDTVLRYISATGKNELTLDDERARSGIADLLRERLDQFLSTPIAPVQDDDALNVTMLSSICGKHFTDDCQGCQSAKASNDERLGKQSG